MLKEYIKKISQLESQEIERMYQLMKEHYENILKDKFLIDLFHKDATMLVYDHQNVLQGFSTYKFYSFEFQGETVIILFSGDTIVSQKYWGNTAQLRIFIQLLKNAIKKYEGQKIYWVLLTKGFRTYMVMPLFFYQFYPSYLSATPDYENKLMKYFIKKVLNKSIIQRDGAIILSSRADFLKADFLVIPKKRCDNAHVKFFIKKNSGYKVGEELVCISQVSVDNLTNACLRFYN